MTIQLYFVCVAIYMLAGVIGLCSNPTKHAVTLFFVIVITSILFPLMALLTVYYWWKSSMSREV